MPAERDAPFVRTGLRGPGMVGAILSIVFALGLIGWAYHTQINGAVIAVGSVVVPGKPKVVQHLDGGIVESISVEDGQRVEAGDVVVRLDDTILKANLDIYKTRLADMVSLRDRLEAEQVEADTINFDGSVLLAGRDLEAVRNGQIAIFKSRRSVLNGRREQLREKIRQFANQKEGIDALIAAKKAQISSIDGELEGMIALSEQGHMRQSQVLAMQRGRSELLGELGEHAAEKARIANSVRDTELEILLAERQIQEEAAVQLREANRKIEELTQQILTTQKQVERTVIGAPVDGIIHEMQVTTVGGVVSPGGTILQIIPTGRGILFETRIDPASVDNVYVGQKAAVRLSAFNRRTTPDIEGEVTNISATTVQDEATGASFYKVYVNAPQSQLERLGDLEVVPGMPVEVFMQTNARSVLSYLLKPLTEQIGHAFREE